MSKPVRLGVVGLGNIGAKHIQNLLDGAVPSAELRAVVARNEVPMQLPDAVRVHSNVASLVNDDEIEAVLVATPTHEHLPQGLELLAAGKHVLMEKPLALCTRDARKLLSHANEGQLFGVVLNQRLDPAYRTIKQLLADGRLGALQRMSWTMTQWYRPDVYFRVSAWRGTWRGEGGGLLVNQCIHNLDVLQWLLGMPGRVRADVHFGKYHAIEVEDEVSAALSWPNGATGTVVASTGEAPGINQLDIIGEQGTLRYDGKLIHLATSDTSVAEHCRETMDLFGMPEFSESVVETGSAINQHALLLQNFAAAIRGDTGFEFAALEGLNSLMLANAMLLSAWQDAEVELPFDDELYSRHLDEKVSHSQLREPEQLDVHIDIEQSFR